MISTTAFAQTLTNVGSEGEDNTFSLPKDSKVYMFYKAGDETNAKLGIDETDATSYVYLGPAAEDGRPFYLWDGGSSVSTIEGFNSHGVLGEGSRFTAGTVGWSGWGVNVNNDPTANNGITGTVDLSGITTDYKFHAAIKVIKKDGDIDLYITDGNKTEFHFTKNLSIPADENWYTIDMSMQDIQDLYGLDFSKDTKYTDLNTLCFVWGNGTIEVDNVFFYGPKTSTGIESINADASEKADNAYYNLAGQRVNKNTKGILIHKGKKIAVK